MDIIPDKILPCNHDDSSSNGDEKGRGDGWGDGYGWGGGDGYGGGNGYGVGDGDGRGDGHGGGRGDGGGDGYGWGDDYGDGYRIVNRSGISKSTNKSIGDGNGNNHGDGEGIGYNIRIFISHETPITAYWVFGAENYPHMGQKLDPTPGDVHEWPHQVDICNQGLHASTSIRDARRFRKGITYKVLCSGWCQFQLDKLVCSRRVIVRRV